MDAKWFQHNGQTYQAKFGMADTDYGPETVMVVFNMAGEQVLKMREPAPSDTMIEWAKERLGQ